MYIQLRDGNGILLGTRILARARYYERAKINAAVARSNRWNTHPELADILQGLSLNHFKHASLTEFESAIANYNANFDCIWNLMGMSKKWSRQNFYLYQQKSKVIRWFLSRLKRRGYADPVMYYGSGTFTAGSKGQRYVPCKWVKEECKEFYHCITVNEFRTSQVCPVCNSRLFDVKKLTEGGSVKKVRGLKWCDHEMCADCPLKNRDAVGATNIYIKTKVDYPIVYARWHRNEDGSINGVVWEGGPTIHILGKGRDN